MMITQCCWRSCLCCVLRCYMSDSSSSPSSTPLVSSPPRSRSTTPPVNTAQKLEQRELLGEGEGEKKCTFLNPLSWGRPSLWWGRSVSTSADANRDRGYWEGLSVDDKREQYKCRDDYVTLEYIKPWQQQQLGLQDTLRDSSPYTPDPTLNNKVSLWRGDITSLEIDAIVNAANSYLMGGGGVDGAIHRAASRSLKEECRSLGGCREGETKLTGGHRLPAKYILHTVGPMSKNRETLTSCYTSCLHLVDQEHIKSVAFCCIATGVYGYPNEEAAHVALATTRDWLEHNADKVDRVIFCVFLEVDLRIYTRLLQYYFPREQLEAAKEETDIEEAVKEETDIEEAVKEETDGRPPLLHSVTEPTGLEPIGTSVDRPPQSVDAPSNDPTPNPTSDPTPDPKKQRTDPS